MKFDVCYVTRLQGERLAPGQRAGEYPVIDSKFLRGRRYRETRVLHPLPRVNELGYDLDSDPRGIYFKQAAYGVPVRMALIAKLLGIEPFRARDTAPARRTYGQAGGLQCPNARCITQHPVERAHLTPKFWIVRSTHNYARCAYCETDTEICGFAERGAKRLSRNFDALERLAPGHVMLFASLDAARHAGLETT